MARLCLRRRNPAADNSSLPARQSIGVLQKICGLSRPSCGFQSLRLRHFSYRSIGGPRGTVVPAMQRVPAVFRALSALLFLSGADDRCLESVETYYRPGSTAQSRRNEAAIWGRLAGLTDRVPGGGFSNDRYVWPVESRCRTRSTAQNR